MVTMLTCSLKMVATSASRVGAEAIAAAEAAAAAVVGAAVAAAAEAAAATAAAAAALLVVVVVVVVVVAEPHRCVQCHRRVADVGRRGEDVLVLAARR